tara:strand:+ start:337 stop:621 length:285 start_codon:yes stop_codon:yes gene_type:complete
MSSDDPKNWRGSRRMLNTRPIYEKDWPILIEKMYDDSLICLITNDGLKWMHGRYEIKASNVREVWGITDSQYRRLYDYILVNDPFEKIMSFTLE